MPEARVEFAKIPVGSNSFDHWELAEYPRSNIPGRMNSTLHGKVFPVPGVLSAIRARALLPVARAANLYDPGVLEKGSEPFTQQVEQLISATSEELKGSDPFNPYLKEKQRPLLHK